MSKKNQKRVDSFEQLEEATITTEQFIEKNQKIIVRVILGAFIIAAIFFGYNKFYKIPLKKEALTQIAAAEALFQRDSFNLALNGDFSALGFLDIIDKYGSTPSGNLAKYYAGLCYLYLGEYNNAITYLEKYTTKNMVFAGLAKSNIGDAYMELENYKKAADYYKKAANDNTNSVVASTILMKAGFAFEKAEDFKNALAMYEKLEKDFPDSMEAREIEKYIARAKAKI